MERGSTADNVVVEEEEEQRYRGVGHVKYWETVVEEGAILHGTGQLERSEPPTRGHDEISPHR